MAEGHEPESVALDELERRMDGLREQCAEASAQWQTVVPVVTAAAVRLGAVGKEFSTSRGDAVSEADRGVLKAIADMVSAVGLVLNASELVIKLGAADDWFDGVEDLEGVPQGSEVDDFIGRGGLTTKRGVNSGKCPVCGDEHGGKSCLEYMREFARGTLGQDDLDGHGRDEPPEGSGEIILLEDYLSLTVAGTLHEGGYDKV